MISRIQKLGVLFVAALLLVFASSAQANPVTWSVGDVTNTYGILDGGTVVSALDFGPTNSGTTQLDIGAGPTSVLFQKFNGPGVNTNYGNWGTGPAGFPGTNFQDFLNTAPYGDGVNAPTTLNLPSLTAGHPYRLQLIAYDGQTGQNKQMYVRLNEDNVWYNNNRVPANTSVARVFMATWTSSGGPLNLDLDDDSNNHGWQVSGLLLQDLFEEPAGVPEPSTYALGLVGLAGLGLFAWRRRRRG